MSDAVADFGLETSAKGRNVGSSSKQQDMNRELMLALLKQRASENNEQLGWVAELRLAGAMEEMIAGMRQLDRVKGLADQFEAYARRFNQGESGFMSPDEVSDFVGLYDLCLESTSNGKMNGFVDTMTRLIAEDDAQGASQQPMAANVEPLQAPLAMDEGDLHIDDALLAQMDQDLADIDFSDLVADDNELPQLNFAPVQEAANPDIQAVTVAEKKPPYLQKLLSQVSAIAMGFAPIKSYMRLRANPELEARMMRLQAHKADVVKAAKTQAAAKKQAMKEFNIEGEKLLASLDDPKPSLLDGLRARASNAAMYFANLKTSRQEPVAFISNRAEVKQARADKQAAADAEVATYRGHSYDPAAYRAQIAEDARLADKYLADQPTSKRYLMPFLINTADGKAPKALINRALARKIMGADLYRKLPNNPFRSAKADTVSAPAVMVDALDGDALSPMDAMQQRITAFWTNKVRVGQRFAAFNVAATETLDIMRRDKNFQTAFLLLAVAAPVLTQAFGLMDLGGFGDNLNSIQMASASDTGINLNELPEARTLDFSALNEPVTASATTPAPAGDTATVPAAEPVQVETAVTTDQQPDNIASAVTETVAAPEAQPVQTPVASEVSQAQPVNEPTIVADNTVVVDNATPAATPTDRFDFAPQATNLADAAPVSQPVSEPVVVADNTATPAAPATPVVEAPASFAGVEGTHAGNMEVFADLTLLPADHADHIELVSGRASDLRQTMMDAQTPGQYFTAADQLVRAEWGAGNREGAVKMAELLNAAGIDLANAGSNAAADFTASIGHMTQRMAGNAFNSGDYETASSLYREAFNCLSAAKEHASNFARDYAGNLREVTINLGISETNVASASSAPRPIIG